MSRSRRRVNYGDHVSGASLLSNKRGKHLLIDSQHVLTLWPVEARIDYRIQATGKGLEELLVKHEKKVEELIAALETISLNDRPTLVNTLPYIGEEGRKKEPDRDTWFASTRGRPRGRNYSTQATEEETAKEKEEPKDATDKHSEEEKPVFQPERLTVLCERLVKQAVERDNVFDILEVIGDHSADLNIFCKRFIAREGSLRKATKNQPLRGDIKQDIEKFLIQAPRVKRHGVAMAPKPNDNYASWDYKPEKLRDQVVYEDISVIVPLPEPSSDDIEKEWDLMLKMNNRVARTIDVLYDKGFFPFDSRDSHRGRYYDNPEGFVRYLCKKVSAETISTDPKILETLHRDAVSIGEAYLERHMKDFELGQLTDCFTLTRQLTEDSSSDNYYSVEDIGSPKYEPIQYRVDLRATYSLKPKRT